MLNIALFGPPGAGKGTQSEFLVKEFNLFYISTGDLLRKEIAAETRLGLEAKSIIASGGLVSDEIIVQIIEKTITEHPEANGFLFDGFPRTYIQCYILEGLMMKLSTSLNCLISLEVDEETSVCRLLERGRTSGRTRRQRDGHPQPAARVHEKTLPVLDFYREKGNYQRVNGNQPIEKVTADIRVIVRERAGQAPLQRRGVRLSGLGPRLPGRRAGAQVRPRVRRDGPDAGPGDQGRDATRPEDHRPLRERPAGARRDRGAADREEAGARRAA